MHRFTLQAGLRGGIVSPESGQSMVVGTTSASAKRTCSPCGRRAPFLFGWLPDGRDENINPKIA